MALFANGLDCDFEAEILPLRRVAGLRSDVVVVPEEDSDD